jgi:hypothetical protein
MVLDLSRSIDSTNSFDIADYIGKIEDKKGIIVPMNRDIIIAFPDG